MAMTSADSQYPALIQALEEAFKLAFEAVKLLIDNFNKGIHNVNTNPLIYLAPDVFGKLDQGLNTLQDWVDKFAKATEQFFKHQVPVIALIKASFDWLTQMQKPVSDIASRVGDFEQNKNCGEWTGQAATYYSVQVVARQQKALDALSPKAEAISKWLTQVAQANIKFLNTYAARIGDIASNAVAALISASTIIGVLEAIGDAAEVCGKLVDSAVTVFGDSVEYYNQAMSFMRDAVSTRTSTGAFPRDAWPQAVS